MRKTSSLLALAFLLSGACLAPAQQAATTNGPAAAPAPVAIPLDQIVAKAEGTADHLRSLNSDLDNDATAARLEAKLPRFSRQVEIYKEESFRVLSSDPSLDALRRLGHAWQIFDGYLASWKDDADQRTKALAARVPRLDQAEKTWAATLPAVVAQGAPAEVVQRVRTVIASIGDARAKLEKEQARLLGVEEKIAQLDLRIGDMASAVKSAQGRVMGRLLVRDEAPVWRLGFGAAMFRPDADDAKNSWSAQFASLASYAGWQKDKLAMHGLATLFLLGALYWFRRRAHVWAGSDPDFGLAAGLFDRPIATALLLSLLATPLVYPLAPRLFWALAGAASLLPAVLILRPLIARRLLPVLDVLIVFYLVDQLRAAAAPLAVLSRLLFLGEMIAAIVLLVLFLGRLRAAFAQGGNDFLGRALRLAARLALLVLAAAGVADALGYVSLGGLLGDGLLRAAYLAVGLNAALRVSDGLMMTVSRLPLLARLAVVRDHHAIIRLRIHRVLFWVALVFWILAVLEAFSIRTEVLAEGQKVLATAIHFGEKPAAIPGAPPVAAHALTVASLLAFGLTVWAAFLISRFIRFILEHDVYPRLHLGHGLPYAISTMLHYTILVVAFVTATAALGVDMTKFTILVSAFGVGIGFGLQNIINNFVSGIILLFERPIKVGDSIQVDEAVGVVERIGIRASILRTTNGSEIIVPNGTLISDRVTNWTLTSRRRIIVIPFNVARGPDPAQVMRIAAEAAARHPGVDPAPAPSVQLTALGANLSFELRAWTGTAEEWTQIRSALMVEVAAALAKENIAVA